jgi:hypothetical protein
MEKKTETKTGKTVCIVFLFVFFNIQLSLLKDAFLYAFS